MLRCCFCGQYPTIKSNKAIHEELSRFWKPFEPIASPTSYCQMLCMGLGGDPLFNNPIHKFYSINNFSEALRVV